MSIVNKDWLLDFNLVLKWDQYTWVLHMTSTVYDDSWYPSERELLIIPLFFIWSEGHALWCFEINKRFNQDLYSTNLLHLAFSVAFTQ